MLEKMPDFIEGHRRSITISLLDGELAALDELGQFYGTGNRSKIVRRAIKDAFKVRSEGKTRDEINLIKDMVVLRKRSEEHGIWLEMITNVIKNKFGKNALVEFGDWDSENE